MIKCKAFITWYRKFEEAWVFVDWPDVEQWDFIRKKEELVMDCDSVEAGFMWGRYQLKKLKQRGERDFHFCFEVIDYRTPPWQHVYTEQEQVGNSIF